MACANVPAAEYVRTIRVPMPLALVFLVPLVLVISAASARPTGLLVTPSLIAPILVPAHLTKTVVTTNSAGAVEIGQENVSQHSSKGKFATKHAPNATLKPLVNVA